MKLEMRYYVLRLLSKILIKPCVAHKEEDCLIKNMFYYKSNIAD